MGAVQREAIHLSPGGQGRSSFLEIQHRTQKTTIMDLLETRPHLNSDTVPADICDQCKTPARAVHIFLCGGSLVARLGVALEPGT
jgi:hypothetical protein